jgi:hypothetical protein
MPFEDEDPPYFEPDAELDALDRAVIGAAIEVHRQVGPELDEGSYESALAIEFRLRGIPFARQVKFDVHLNSGSTRAKRSASGFRISLWADGWWWN